MRKFFNKMKIVDEQIVETLHIHRSVHLAKLMVQFSPLSSRRRGTDDVCHTASLLCGCVWTIASVIARSALLVFALMVVLSVAFGFCWIHRAFCAYNLLVNACIEYEKLFGFGTLLTPARWFVLALGAVLFFLYFRRKWLVKHKKYRI